MMSPDLQIVPAVSILALSIIATRISPVRAVWLGVRSLLKGPSIQSQRFLDVAEIRNKIQTSLSESRDQFLVVRGPKGIGKSVAIETALANMWSVCNVEKRVEPNLTKDEIVERVLMKFTGIRVNWIDIETTARKIVFWNRLFTFGAYKPTIIISAQDRNENETYAQIAEAARDLALMGLRVVVDACEDSLPRMPITERELYFEMEPMSLQTIKLPHLKDLIESLNQVNIYNEVKIALKSSIFDYLNFRLLFEILKLKDSGCSRRISSKMECN